MRQWMKKYATAEYAKRTIVMLVSVALMGVGVRLLNLTTMGNDPYSAVNYGVSERLGLSFGTYQLLSNVVLFVIVVVQNRKLFGLGTIGNMVLVGYSADLTGWLLERAGVAAEGLTIAGRVGLMVPALLLFLVAAALYMNCGLGTSPFDAFSFLIHEKLEQWTKRTLKFRFVRIGYDAAFTLVAFLVGGDVGVVTVLMVLLLGPAIDAVAKLVKRSGLFETKKVSE